MLDEAIKEDAVKIFHSKAKELGLRILEADGPEDHIHVLVRSNPTLAPSDIAKNLKGSSSHYVNHVTLKNDKHRSLYWQDGYGVTSISPGAVKSICEYIKKQKGHHCKNSIEANLEL